MFWHALQSMHRGHIANDAASVLQHVFHYPLCQKVLPAKVDVKQLVELLRCHFKERPVHCDSSVIDQAIDAAEKLAGLIGKVRNLFQCIEVCLKRRGFASHRLYFLNRSFYSGIALHVVEHDVGTLPRKFETDLMSDPCVGAGDQRFFPMQSEFLRHRRPTDK